ARADDHLLGPPDDMENIAFEARKVSGVEPAFAVDHGCGESRFTIVAAHDIRSANVKLADLAVAERNAVERANAGLDTGQQRSDRLGVARRISPPARDSR